MFLVILAGVFGVTTRRIAERISLFCRVPIAISLSLTGTASSLIVLPDLTIAVFSLITTWIIFL